MIIVDSATAECLVEFLGGSVSCNGWNFWARGGSGDGSDVFLVTTGLDKIVIWDCVSGRIESHQSVPPEAGYIEGYDTVTPESFGEDKLVSVVCCTDGGRAFYWPPRRNLVPDEDDFLPKAPVKKGNNDVDSEEEEEERRAKERELYKDLVDLMSMVEESGEDLEHFKNGFRGISFGSKREIVAWGIHYVFLWLPTIDNMGYTYHSCYTAGESVYGISHARADGAGSIHCVLEDGWSYKFATTAGNA